MTIRLGLRARHHRGRRTRCSTPGSPPRARRRCRIGVEPHIAPAELEAWLGPGRAPRRARRVRDRRDRPRCAARLDARRLPAPAPAQPPARRARTRSTSTACSATCRSWRWTTAGPVHPDALARLRLDLQRAGISVLGVDKFPRLLDYVVPDRVRIADASRVRLGAYLSPGTTVHARGLRQLQRRHPRRVDGRGAHLAGRRRRRRLRHRRRRLDHGHPVGRRHRAGRRSASASLLGANAGIGISIGDDSVVEAGLYVTAGTKVTLLDPSAPDAAPRVVKARRAERRRRACCSAATR